MLYIREKVLLTLTGAADPSFRSPMSIAVIGGLITSTVLSLLVIPVVFTYIDDLEQWFRRQFARRRRREDDSGPDVQVPADSDPKARASAAR